MFHAVERDKRPRMHCECTSDLDGAMYVHVALNI